MTRIGILLGCAALVAATAGNAQLLGGGGGGGIGGGLGGAMGSAGGALGGSLRSERLSDAARADRVRSRELRAERRRAERAERASPGVGGGVAGSIATGPGSLTGSASGNVSNTAGGRAVDSVRGRSYAVRAEAQARGRGLRRAGRSASGVSIYLPATAVGVPVVVAQPYPVYSGGGGYAYSGGGYAYGGGYDRETVVVVPDRAYMDRQYEDLREDTAGTGVTVERRGEDLVVQLPADITFAFDRADIQPRFVAALDAVARTIAEYRDTDVEILGHTDAVGSDAYNFALSQRRGSSVADFLVSRRAAPDRLVVAAMGESEPVATNASVAGRAANRRVEIILHPRAA